MIQVAVLWNSLGDSIPANSLVELLRMQGFRVERSPLSSRKLDVVILSSPHAAISWLDHPDSDPITSRSVPVLCIGPRQSANVLSRALKPSGRAVAWLPRPFDATALKKTLDCLFEAQFDQRDWIVHGGFEEKDAFLLQSILEKMNFSRVIAAEKKTLDSLLRYEFSHIRCILLYGKNAERLLEGFVLPNKPTSLFQRVPVILVGTEKSGTIFEKLEAAVTAVISEMPTHPHFKKRIKEALKNSKASFCFQLAIHQLYQKARSHFKQGKEQAGMKTLNRILAIQPNHWDTWLLKAEYYRLSKDFQSAQKMLQHALALNPLSPTIYGRALAVARDAHEKGLKRKILQTASSIFEQHPAITTSLKDPR